MHYPKFKKVEENFKDLIPNSKFLKESFCENGCDLLEKLLRLNPKERITPDEALKHPYFNDVPLKLK